MSKVLIMNYDMNNGTRKEFTITEPKSSLTLANAQAAANVVIEKELFKVNGVKPTSLIDARYVETVVTMLN